MRSKGVWYTALVHTNIESWGEEQSAKVSKKQQQSKINGEPGRCDVLEAEEGDISRMERPNVWTAAEKAREVT